MNHYFSVYFYKISFGLIIISILSACQGTGLHQAYEGPAKTDSEITTFIVTDQYNLLSIDGTLYQQTILKDGATIKLLPGSHQLIIEYQDIFDINGEHHEKVTSKPIAITFTMEAGNQYSIQAAPMETLEQAQAFAEKPSISIIDTTTKQTVAAMIKYNLYGRGLFTTLFGASNPESAASSIDMGNTNTANKNDKALEMLKYWWQTADEKQQGDFRQWLKNQ